MLSFVHTRPWLAIAIPALLALLISALPTLIEGVPKPVIEDEWGYLLTAETLAEGRLSNPTHDQWQGMEAVHQFHVPTYNSKYPPGQSLFLALGQKLGHPIMGVWITIALMVGSIVWMLLGMFSARWALMGGFVAAAQYVVLGQPHQMGTFGYWSQSYWGGAVAAFGGALMFGALVRTLKQPKIGTSITLALGLLLLANTRPLEGLLASLPAGIVLLGALIRRRFDAASWTKVIAPIVLVLIPGFVAMGTYNKAVTGKTTEMPWTTHYEQYCIFPLFLWQDLAPDRDWRHEEMAVFHGKVEREMHERHGTPKGFAKATFTKSVRFFLFYLGPFLLPLLLVGLGMLRKGWVRFAVGTSALVFGVGLMKFGSPPHYSAPIAGLMIALIVQSLKELDQRKWGQRIVQVLVLVAWLGIGFGVYESTQSAKRTRAEFRHIVQEQLEEKPGPQLALVRFGPLHGEGDHWIWNAADIDASKVVWIRDPGPEGRAKMLAAFPGRTVWRVDVGFEKGCPVPVPYQSESE